MRGLEPPCLATHAPEACASTNFATCPLEHSKGRALLTQHAALSLAFYANPELNRETVFRQPAILSLPFHNASR